MSESHFLIVLDDGETYTDLESARIVEVTPKLLEQIQNDGKIKWFSKEDGIVGVYKVEHPTDNAERWDAWWDSII